MSTPSILEHTTNLAEHEFAKPCEVLAWECPRIATWGVWASHSYEVCPFTALLCDVCEEEQRLEMTRVLKDGNWHCVQCKQLITGLLEDNHRAIRL